MHGSKVTEGPGQNELGNKNGEGIQGQEVEWGKVSMILGQNI